MLEDFYYGIAHPANGPNDLALPLHPDCGASLRAQCPECHETCHTNVALMDHLKQHVIGANGKAPTAVQCRYCLQHFDSAGDRERHQYAQHPRMTRERVSGFACLICEQRFGGNAALTAHMQRTHVQGELPYRCGGCAFASSSLRRTVDHFYADHAGSAALQCPLCMQCWTVRSAPADGATGGGQLLAGNVAAYLRHLRQHVHAQQDQMETTGRRSQSLKCSRCQLAFLTPGDAKLHQYAHVTHVRHVNETLCIAQTKIARPKAKYNYVTNNATLLPGASYAGLTMVVENGCVCLECDADFEERSHFP